MKALLTTFLLIFSGFQRSSPEPEVAINFIILSQPAECHKALSEKLAKGISASCEAVNKKCKINRFHDTPTGYWTIFAILNKLKLGSQWYIFIEDATKVKVSAVFNFLESKKTSDKGIFGYGLFDRSHTIIHHFGMYAPQDKVFLYPDFSAGLVVSGSAIIELQQKLDTIEPPNFSIDPKYEIALIFYRQLGVELEPHNDIFCLEKSKGCAIYYEPQVNIGCKLHSVKPSEVYVMIKTFSGYHRSRLVYLKRTWTRDLPLVDYCSDTVDEYVPTVDLGVNNTERGHCAKTWAILQRFIKQSTKDVKWLLIADDDTLISFGRLIRLLGCYDHNEKIIIGERYGYGFGVQAGRGYDYPTGGSGMVFSRPAVISMLQKCGCPSDDSPDDMIIGMCAASVDVPVVHNAAFHQARSIDYAPDYIRKLLPISLHKFEDIDPYEEFMTYLNEDTHIDHNEL